MPYPVHGLEALTTPCLILDEARMTRNIRRLADKATALALLAPHRMFCRTSSVPAGRPDDVHLLIASAQLVLQQIPEQLHGQTLEGQGRAILQFGRPGAIHDRSNRLRATACCRACRFRKGSRSDGRTFPR
jgi:hypothetical protein